MKPAGEPDRRPIIAVIGSGDVLSDAQQRSPREVGQWIAQAGFHLLTGGGAGVMEAVSAGFCSVPHDGCSIGIIPAGKPPSQYPNRWIEVPIRTHLKGANPRGPDSRNHINILTASAVIAFPGRGGTRAELELTLARKPPCPLIACLRPNESIGGLDCNAVRARGVTVVPSPDEVVQFLKENFDLERTKATTAVSGHGPLPSSSRQRP
jgi:uncharacterized protein (TIGR00725 family)